MSKLKVAKAGEEVLRKKASPVEDVKAKEIQSLIDSMTETMNDLGGVGIAAPQVFKSLRIFIMHSNPNPRYPGAPELGPVAVINPKISELSQETEKEWEGCLSAPGIRGLVPRHKSLVLEYTTREGEIKKQRFEGFVARIIQHEADHLDGILFIDRVKDRKDLIDEETYQRMVAGK